LLENILNNIISYIILVRYNLIWVRTIQYRQVHYTRIYFIRIVINSTWIQYYIDIWAKSYIIKWHIIIYTSERGAFIFCKHKIFSPRVLYIYGRRGRGLRTKRMYSVELCGSSKHFKENVEHGGKKSVVPYIQSIDVSCAYCSRQSVHRSKSIKTY